MENYIERRTLYQLSHFEHNNEVSKKALFKHAHVQSHVHSERYVQAATGSGKTPGHGSLLDAIPGSV